MNFKTTLVLLVLAAAGAGIWLFTSSQDAKTDSDEPQATKTEAEKRLVLDPPVKTVDVVRIEFERTGKSPMVFERPIDESEPTGRANWQMVEPYACPAIGYMVDTLLSMVTTLQYQNSFTLGETNALTAADAGLEPPQATMTLIKADESRVAVEIGRQASLSNDRYVRVAGSNTVLQVAQQMDADLERSANDYRDKGLLRFQTADVRQLVIEHDGKTYELSRPDGASDDWLFTKPVWAHAKPADVRKLLSSIATLRAGEFVDESIELPGGALDPPFLRIQVTTDEKHVLPPEPTETATEDGPPEETAPPQPKIEIVRTTQTLVIGTFADLASESRYVQKVGDPAVGTVRSTQVDRLVPSLGALRDPSVMRVAAANITSVDLSHADGTTAKLNKVGQEWNGGGDLDQLDDEAVGRLLAAVEGLSAIDYVDGATDLSAYGLDSPRMTATVTTASGAGPITLEVGANTASGQNTYVKRAGQDTIYVVSSARLDPLTMDPLTLRSRTITAFDPDQINWIKVDRDDKSYEVERGEDGGGWTMSLPADTPADNRSINELAQALARLRATAVAARGDGAEFGLDQPQITIEFTVAESTDGPADESTPAAETPHTLLVTNEPGPTYARFDDLPFVFVLDPTVYDTFGQELIERGLFDLEAEQIQRIQIDDVGGSLVFERGDKGWVYPADLYTKLDQKKLGRLADRLATLRVQAYIAFDDANLAALNLDAAPVTVTIQAEPERTITLKLSRLQDDELPRKAVWVEQGRVFVLEHLDAEWLSRRLGDYLPR